VQWVLQEPASRALTLGFLPGQRGTLTWVCLHVIRCPKREFFDFFEKSHFLNVIVLIPSSSARNSDVYLYITISI
jgi:hypothetical protein